MDPLSQLSDIQLPQQINNYPIAYGWLILYAVIIALFIITIFLIIKHRKKVANKKQAIQMLAQSSSVSEVLTVLKWAIMAYFPRHQVASLSGVKLQQFMKSTLAPKHHESFEQQSESIFSKLYQSSFDDNELTALKGACNLWLSKALPLNKYSETNL